MFKMFYVPRVQLFLFPESIIEFLYDLATTISFNKPLILQWQKLSHFQSSTRKLWPLAKVIQLYYSFKWLATLVVSTCKTPKELLETIRRSSRTFLSIGIRKQPNLIFGWLFHFKAACWAEHAKAAFAGYLGGRGLYQPENLNNAKEAISISLD